MRTITLGRTGLSVSAVCLGCMSFGSSAWRGWVLDEPESLSLLGRALDGGITFFDTANVYSGGHSERVLGKFLKGAVARDKVVVSTKGFYPTTESSRTGLSRANIVDTVDQSLRRLGFDYIDIFQVHRWDDQTPVEETMAALAEIVTAGKARFAGASNMRTWHLAKSQMAAQAIGPQGMRWGGYATMQNHYNLLYREDERDLIPFCRDQNIGLMCWSPLARGRLGRPHGDSTARGAIDDVADTLYGPADDPILGDLAAVAQARHAAPAQVALGWIVGKGIVPVVGATKPKHIDDAAAAGALTLSSAEIARLEQSYTARPLAELPWNAKNQTDPKDLVARVGRA